jgi:hypothetical protein
MRKVSILSLWLAAFLMAVCFIGCSNGNSSDDGNSSETTSSAITFKGSESMVDYTFVFKSDKSFTNSSAINSYAEETDYSGTYTGDPSKDGSVEITILKERVGRELQDYAGSDATQELTITNGKFTFDGTEFTRQ